MSSAPCPTPLRYYLSSTSISTTVATHAIAMLGGDSCVVSAVALGAARGMLSDAGNATAQGFAAGAPRVRPACLGRRCQHPAWLDRGRCAVRRAVQRRRGARGLAKFCGGAELHWHVGAKPAAAVSLGAMLGFLSPTCLVSNYTALMAPLLDTSSTGTPTAVVLPALQ